MYFIAYRPHRYLLRSVLLYDIVNTMPTITIQIPKNILERGAVRRFVAVDPKEFEKELRRKWEEADTRQAIKIARQEKKRGGLRVVTDLKEIMR